MKKLILLLAMLLVSGTAFAPCAGRFNSHYGYVRKIIVENATKGCFRTFGWVRMERYIPVYDYNLHRYVTGRTEIVREYFVPRYTNFWYCKGFTCRPMLLGDIVEGDKLTIEGYKIGGNFAVEDFYVLDGIKWPWE